MKQIHLQLVLLLFITALFNSCTNAFIRSSTDSFQYSKNDFKIVSCNIGNTIIERSDISGIITTDTIYLSHNYTWDDYKNEIQLDPQNIVNNIY